MDSIRQHNARFELAAWVTTRETRLLRHQHPAQLRDALGRNSKDIIRCYGTGYHQAAKCPNTPNPIKLSPADRLQIPRDGFCGEARKATV